MERAAIDPVDRELDLIHCLPGSTRCLGQVVPDHPVAAESADLLDQNLTNQPVLEHRWLRSCNSRTQQRSSLKQRSNQVASLYERPFALEKPLDLRENIAGILCQGNWRAIGYIVNELTSKEVVVEL